MKRLLRNRRWMLPLIAGAGILLMPVSASSLTASVVMPSTTARAINVQVDPDDLKPAQCVTVLDIERIQVGSGIFSSDVAAERSLLLGSQGNDEITGGDTNDCLHGGIGTDLLIGGSGNDVCIGSATSTFDATCEDTYVV